MPFTSTSGGWRFTPPNTEQFTAKLKMRLSAAVKAARGAAWEFGEEVMEDSQENYVPIDTGDLKDTGHTQWEDSGNVFRVTLGYGGPSAGYALAVHENLNMSPVGTVIHNRLGGGVHERIGGPKYLERPFRKAAPQFLKRIKEAAQEAMKSP